jgi:hypothetical protein
MVVTVDCTWCRQRVLYIFHVCGFTDLPLLLFPNPIWAPLGGGTGVISLGERLIVGCPLPCFSTVTTTCAWAWWGFCVDFGGQKRRALGTLCYRGGGLLFLCRVGRK